jgi:hypothetical protein
MEPQPLIIIGAPRSGTNILRDVLTRLPGFETWPCDEINFVWKHGNIRNPYDDLPADAVTAGTRSFVRRQFRNIGQRANAAYVVEKTCANSMRVAYVDRVVPEARYVLLLRDGCDAVASSMDRWAHPAAEPSYFLSKARFIAPGDYFWVAYQVVMRRVRGLSMSGRTWSSWGPVSRELESLVRQRRPLAEICALQWTQCVDMAIDALTQFDSARWMTVAFTDFLENPDAEIGRIGRFVGANLQAGDVERACGLVRRDRVGRAAAALSPEERQHIETLIMTTSQRVADLLAARS